MELAEGVPVGSEEAVSGDGETEEEVVRVTEASVDRDEVNVPVGDVVVDASLLVLLVWDKDHVLDSEGVEVDVRGVVREFVEVGESVIDDVAE